MPISAVSRVSERILQIQKLRPPQVPITLEMGWIAALAEPLIPHSGYYPSYRLNNHVLRLSLLRVQADPLFCLRSTLNQQTKQSIAIKIKESLFCWSKLGFIHGDLSPRNILINTKPFLQIYFIDWVLDLQSFIATPYYSNQEVYKGKRSLSSDQYAARKIVEWLLQ